MMNMKQRMLSVIKGEKPDRVPFVQYSNIGGQNEKVWEKLGRENMGILQWCGMHRIHTPNCRTEQEKITKNGKTVWRNRLITPEGSITEERTLVPSMGVSTFVEHYIKTIDDYYILMAYLRDIKVTGDNSSVKQVIKNFGDDGLPHVSLGRTPFQQLWIQWVSINDLSIHMLEKLSVVEECMELLGKVLLEISDAVLSVADEVDVPYVVVGDNITAPVIGEERFRKYCLPYYRKISERMAEKGILLFVHMDGDLKPLWNAIEESGVMGLDSFSPTPDNDTSVSDAVSVWPDMRLLVNFPSSIHMAEPETIYQTAMQILSQGAHTGRLQIQISENMPPNTWQKSYPEIVRAIQDFGRS